MKTITLVPGSAEWLQSRSASKAPAVMSASKYQTRADLLRQMATGITPDVDANTQRLYDAGHASEASAREIAEDVLCDGLSPVCGTTDDGYLSASFDGLTFDGKVGFEHKLWNETLAAAVRAGELPEEYKWQMDQQILVGGLDYVLFMVSDGTREKMVSIEYRSTNERALALLAAWRQFDIDLAAYQHVEAAPVATAAPINELPALMVEITGSVTASNLVQWKAIVTDRIAGIKTDLQTDNDFADADAMVKFLDDGERRIDLVKAQAQANAADIDRVFRALDEIKASMRAKRLELDKLVKARKENIRGEIVRDAFLLLSDHVSALNKRIGRSLIKPEGDFHGAIRNKRTVKSLRDACDSELARAKIAASEQADRISINLSSYADIAAGHEFLFRDLDALVLKDADGFSAIVQQRIDAHKKQEEDRIAAAIKFKEDQIAKQMRELDAAEDAAIVAKTPEPAKPPATVAPTAAEVGGYTAASPVVEADWPVMRRRLNNLAVRMSASQLYELCIHAVRILESRKEAA